MHLRIGIVRSFIAYAALLAAFSVFFTAAAQQIAFTWDDLPAHSALPKGETRVEIAEKILSTMKKEHLPPAYGFVNGIRTEDEPLSTPVLKAWRDAGFPLGNHTWSHINLNEYSLEDFESDTLKNEPLLKSVAQGADWHWLRFPFLAEGNTQEKRDGARKFLAAHGYRVAGVTMSFGDYSWNQPYARCVAKGDTAAVAELEKSYLAAADATIDYSRSMAKTLYGHDIPYVLLMHVGAFDARMLPRLIALYRSRGFSFVTLEAAEKDPFYANDLDLSLPANPDTLEQAMKARNLEAPPRPNMSSALESVCR